MQDNSNNSNSKFNQKKYIIEYNKKNYKQFKVNLKNKEYEELIKLLNLNNLNKTHFVRLSIEKLKNNEYNKNI